MLELLLYFLLVAPFLMNEREKKVFWTILIIVAVFLHVVSLFYE